MKRLWLLLFFLGACGKENKTTIVNVPFEKKTASETAISPKQDNKKFSKEIAQKEKEIIDLQAKILAQKNKLEALFLQKEGGLVSTYEYQRQSKIGQEEILRLEEQKKNVILSRDFLKEELSPDLRLTKLAGVGLTQVYDKFSNTYKISVQGAPLGGFSTKWFEQREGQWIDVQGDLLSLKKSNPLTTVFIRMHITYHGLKKELDLILEPVPLREYVLPSMQGVLWGKNLFISYTCDTLEVRKTSEILEKEWKDTSVLYSIPLISCPDHISISSDGLLLSFLQKNLIQQFSFQDKSLTSLPFERPLKGHIGRGSIWVLDVSGGLYQRKEKGWEKILNTSWVQDFFILQERLFLLAMDGTLSVQENDQSSIYKLASDLQAEELFVHKDTLLLTLPLEDSLKIVGVSKERRVQTLSAFVLNHKTFLDFSENYFIFHTEGGDILKVTALDPLWTQVHKKILFTKLGEVLGIHIEENNVFIVAHKKENVVLRVLDVSKISQEKSLTSL